MNLRSALAGSGLLLAAVSFFVGTLVGGEVEPRDNVLEPAAVAVGIVDSLCPDDWNDTSERDEHTLVRACGRTVNGVRWQVILKPDATSWRDFDHATPIDIVGADHVFDPTQVPGWPR